MNRRLVLTLLAVLLPGLTTAQPAPPVTVFAAASLTDAIRDVSAAWASQGNPPLRTSFSSSSTLARQIEQGAPANVFASADERWMNYLAERGLIVPETRRSLLGNRLVLVVPKDRARTVTVGRDLDLNALLGQNGRLATGDPAHVPVGLYAREALIFLGLWDKVEPRLARADDVRAALLLVERGEAPAGIVYATDAAASLGVAVAGMFPENTHERITYPFAVVRANDTPQARALMAFLQTDTARAIFVRRGFTIE